MTPRTKLQKLVEESSRALPLLSEAERQEVFSKLSPHIWKKDAKGMCYCLDCGHTWKATSEEQKAEITVCPQCGNKLTLDDSRRRNFSASHYFEIITTCNGFQVIRMFYFRILCRKRKQPLSFIDEVYQRWTKPGLKTTIRALRQGMVSWNIDVWAWQSGLEIRQERVHHQLIPTCRIGKMKLLPEVKKFGLTQNLHGMCFQRVLEALLSNNYFETLWKTDQYEIARYYLQSDISLENYWPQIKIAHRHKYKILDASTWIDVVRMLRRLGKDDRNPKFILPEDLHGYHDHLERKIRELEKKEYIKRERIRFQQDLEEARKREEQYKLAKSRFFELLFEDNEIVVEPLKSVEEFLAEGTLHHHCVFTNKYYMKDDMLILHALVNDQSVATIEFSLVTLQVVQCRGTYNKTPKQKERIEKLIYKNIGKIIKCRDAKKIEAA